MLIILTWTIEWHLVYSQCCVIITSKTFSFLQKETSYPHKLLTTTTSPPLNSRQLSICFLWIQLFWIFQWMDSYSMLLCVWLSFSIVFSQFTHVVACISVYFIPFHDRLVFPLYGYTTFYLSIQLLMDSWAVSAFWLLWLVLLWTCCSNICLNTCFKFIWVVI